MAAVPTHFCSAQCRLATLRLLGCCVRTLLPHAMLFAPGIWLVSVALAACPPPQQELKDHFKQAGRVAHADILAVRSLGWQRRRGGGVARRSRRAEGWRS